MAYFTLKVKKKIGAGKLKVYAQSGNENASSEIKIEIRNPNPALIVEQDSLIKGNSSVNLSLTAPGMQGTNEAWVELSSMPSLNLSRHLPYLIRYPHGCIEQTTSSVFPQLYLSNLVDVSENQKRWIEDNIRLALQKYVSFQRPDGGFSYWPGYGETSDWGTTYAGHFMILAEKEGYTLPPDMKKTLVKLPKRQSPKF